MEYIQSHRRKGLFESFEERYLLLVSIYPLGCLSMDVTPMDADVWDSSSLDATLQLLIHLACNEGLSIVKRILCTLIPTTKNAGATTLES